MAEEELAGEETGKATWLTAEEWANREKRDAEEVASLEEWLTAFEKRAAQRAYAEAEAEAQQKEKLRLFRLQLAIDLAEERKYTREDDKRREEAEINDLSKRKEEDEVAAALLRVMTKGTVESRQRQHEERICTRRAGIAELRRLAEERRKASLEQLAQDTSQHQKRMQDMNERFERQRLHGLQQKQRRAQEWEEILAERRRRQRARERELEQMRLKEELAEVAHQRILQREFEAQRAREQALAATQEALRRIDETTTLAARDAHLRELTSAKEELLDRAAAISEQVREQLGFSSHIALLCNAARDKAQDEGRPYCGLRRLMDATLRPTHLSPEVDDPGLTAILKGPIKVDVGVQTLKGKQGGKGAGNPR